MQRHRARITAGELVLVCSHYDLGVIDSARKLRAGSRASPKVLLIGKDRAYLLKRRAPGGADLPSRVALSHQVLLFLDQRGFPVPRLIGTRTDNNSMLQLGDHVYEVFRFVTGSPYDRTPAAAREAGALLARCHTLMLDLRPGWTPPARTYHNHQALPARIASLPARLAFPGAEALAKSLTASYGAAASAAEKLGVSSRPSQLIHGDWHPGNLVFRPGVPGQSGGVAAVLDFDSVRLDQRVVDLANGALQFSIARRFSGAAKPTEWGIAFDNALFSAFVAGYRESGAVPLESSEITALPWLMIEALIAEAVIPIAATGRLGKADGAMVLKAVDEAALRLVSAAPTLVRLAAGP